MTTLKYLLVFIIPVMLLTGCSATQKVTATTTASPAWLQQWLQAWEFTSRNIFQLPDQPVPQMLFFDKEFVYTNSIVSAPNGTPIEGPPLFGKPIAWRKAPHTGTVTTPDGQQLPLGVTSFAAPLDKDSAGSFFVMAAPVIWEEAGIKSKELGLRRLLTGVFLHEFSHTRQLHTYGALVSQLEKQYTLKKELNDNIIQQVFKQDSVYVQAYLAEVKALYDGFFCSTQPCRLEKGRDALRLMQSRQYGYFVKENAILKDLDAVFLTLEGCGQYAAVAWLAHAKGGGLRWSKAVEGFRRDRSQWSQEEGLGLFLLLQAITQPNWARDFFGKEPKMVADVLRQAVQ